MRCVVEALAVVDVAIPQMLGHEDLDGQAEQLLHDWRFTARPEQVAPDGTWQVWAYIAVRGAGKTRSGSEWVREKVRGGAGRIALIAPTAGDARDVMVEGDSGLLSVCWDGDVDHKGRVWVAEAVIFGALGLVLLLLPTLAVALWPWAMTPPLSQLYSGHFITLAVVSAFAVREPRWDAVRIMVVTIMVLAVLVLAVSIVHLDRFKPNPSTLIWFIFFGAQAIGLGALLWRRRARRSPGAAVPSAGVS